MRGSFDYDVFLCFAVHDEAIVRPVWQQLSESGLRVFWSDVTLKENLGDLWYDHIQSALEKSRHLILIASKASMESKWVKKEYQAFYDQLHEQETRRLIPVLTRDLKISQLPLLIRGLEAIKLDDPDSIMRIIHLLGGTPLQKLKEEKDRLQLKERRLLRMTEIGGALLMATVVLLGFLFGALIKRGQLGQNQSPGYSKAARVIAELHVVFVSLIIVLQFTPLGGKMRNWSKYGIITESTMAQFWRGWRWIWFTWLALYGWLSGWLMKPQWYQHHERLIWSVADIINISNAFGFFFCFLALDEPSIPTLDEPHRAEAFRWHVKLVVAGGVVVGVLSVLGRTLRSTQLEFLGPLLASCYTGLAMAYLFGRFDSHHMNIRRPLLAPLYLYVIIQLTWATFQRQIGDIQTIMLLAAALILKILLFGVVTYWLHHDVLLKYIKKAEDHFQTQS